ncbi:MAG: hypothetical protein GY906_37965 [bacterium]|nr:hypothetical protein [bacterium]
MALEVAASVSVWELEFESALTWAPAEAVSVSELGSLHESAAVLVEELRLESVAATR